MKRKPFLTANLFLLITVLFIPLSYIISVIFYGIKTPDFILYAVVMQVTFVILFAFFYAYQDTILKNKEEKTNARKS